MVRNYCIQISINYTGSIKMEVGFLVYTTPDGSMISECDWSYDGSKIAIKTNDYNGYNTNIYIIDMMEMF
jgi:hypothetical protein